MKRNRLPVITLFAILLTSGVVGWTGWSAPTHSLAAHHAGQAAHDPFATDTAWRWRQCQPRHWRYCMLQPQ
jgi:hypothetical protein